MTTPNYKGTNTGHGHVWARPDGVKARCGGLGLCSVCNRDATAILAMCSTPAPTTDERAKLAEEVKRLANESAMQTADDEWNPIANPKTARAALHAAIDRLAEAPAQPVDRLTDEQILSGYRAMLECIEFVGPEGAVAAFRRTTGLVLKGGA